MPEPPARSGWGFDRAVLFWDSAVNDSLKCSDLIKRTLIELRLLPGNGLFGSAMSARPRETLRRGRTAVNGNARSRRSGH